MTAGTGPRPVLFASPAAHGQLNPLAAIAKELARQGVPDLWYGSEEEARGRVERIGGTHPVRFASSGPTLVVQDEATYAAVTKGPRTTAGFVAALRLLRHPSITEIQYPWMLRLIDELRPRLMVIDVLHLPALDAAMTRRVPFVLSIPFPVSLVYAGRLPWSYPTPTSGLPLRMSAAQRAANVSFRLRLQLALLTRTGLFRAARHRRAMGIPNALADLERYSAAATAVFGYSLFGLEYPFRAPEHLHMLGSAVDPQEADGDGDDPDLMRWLAAHPSVVYVGLGTIARLSATQLAALAAALDALGPEHHVLWKLTADQRALLPERLPAHVRVQEWLPSQCAVLAHPHVRAFVTHGGANGVHEGVYFGKPLLVMPFFLDCYDLAARMVDAGVGLAVDRPPAFTPAEVAGKVRRLLTEASFTERSLHWSERIRQAGGPRRGADLVAGIVNAGGPEPHDSEAAVPDGTGSRR
jgi:polyene glycosyltransferase